MHVAFRCIPGLLVLGLAACASSSETLHDPARPDHAPSVLDGTYESEPWQWKKQLDGAFLLTHAAIQQCFISVDWPRHAFGNENEQPGRNYASRSIDGTEYRVAERDLGGGMHEIHYQRNTMPTQFSVFGNGQCHDAAREVLSNLETGEGSSD